MPRRASKTKRPSFSCGRLVLFLVQQILFPQLISSFPAVLPCFAIHRIETKASRLCETCTFKINSTCAYCDVCFFNRHPGLDDLSKAEATAIGEGRGGAVRRGRGGARAWTLSAANKEVGWNHRQVIVTKASKCCTWCSQKWIRTRKDVGMEQGRETRGGGAFLCGLASRFTSKERKKIRDDPAANENNKYIYFHSNQFGCL